MPVLEDYSPIYAGDTAIPFVPQFINAEGPVPLANVTLSMIMVDINTNVRTVCTGPWLITADNAPLGIAQYTWQAAEVSTPGVKNLQIELTIGGAVVHTDLKPLTILAPL